MSDADWFTAPPLRTPRLRLDALRLADAPAFLAALGSADERAEVLAHLRYPPLADLAAVRRVVAAALTDPDRVPYAQRLADGTFVGTTSFYEIAPAVRAVAIGHTWVARRWWRTFVNTESKLAMLTHAFETLGAERVVWHTDIRNVRSQEAVARLGAQREGVLRHHRIRSDGSWRDTVQLAMLAEEWPQVRARLQAGERTPPAARQDGPHAQPRSRPMTAELETVRDDARSRYEGRIDGEVVTVLAFVREGDVLALTHTGTEPAFREQGLASALTEAALDDVRRRGEKVRPSCAFAVEFLDDHPEYADLRV